MQIAPLVSCVAAMPPTHQTGVHTVCMRSNAAVPHCFPNSSLPLASLSSWSPHGGRCDRPPPKPHEQPASPTRRRQPWAAVSRAARRAAALPARQQTRCQDLLTARRAKNHYPGSMLKARPSRTAGILPELGRISTLSVMHQTYLKHLSASDKWAANVALQCKKQYTYEHY